MNPDRRHLTPSSTHGLVIFSAVAICLSAAGLGLTLSLHHHHEINNEIRKRTPRNPHADNAFGPELQILEVFEHPSSSAQPSASTNDEATGPTDDGNRFSSSAASITPSNSLAAESDRVDVSGAASGASIPPNSAHQAPESATVSSVTTAPVAVAPLAAAPLAATPLATTPVLATPVIPTAVAADPNKAPQANTQPTFIRQEPAPPVPLVQCGSAQCPEGEVCCNASCGTCTRPGELCSQQVCGMSTYPGSVLCGLNECNVGEICCNASCGTCARSEAECDPNQECDNPVEYPQSVTCGMETCNTGLVCCNPSCGICAPYGVPCSQDACD